MLPQTKGYIGLILYKCQAGKYERSDRDDRFFAS